MAIRATVLVLSVLSVAAHPSGGHHIESRSIANGAWFQPRDHPAAKLFARQDGPAVGTPGKRRLACLSLSPSAVSHVCLTLSMAESISSDKRRAFSS